MEVIRRRREAAPTRVAFSGKPEIMMVQGPSRWMRLRYLFILSLQWVFGNLGKTGNSKNTTWIFMDNVEIGSAAQYLDWSVILVAWQSRFSIRLRATLTGAFLDKTIVLATLLSAFSTPIDDSDENQFPRRS